MAKGASGAKKLSSGAKRKGAPDAPAGAVKKRASSSTGRSKNTAPRPAADVVQIFQIYYDPLHRALLDPAFVPLDNCGKASPFLEFDIFNRLYRSEHVRNAALWGAVSWRFTEKTGLSGADLLRLIEDNPGHDIYFCNPYPKHEALFHNLWVQGESAHPKFLELSRAFLKAAGLPVEETELIWPSGIYSSANYFVGSPAFWERYLGFVGEAIRAADKNLPEEIKTQLYSDKADDRNLHGGASYMPFIVERLFPLFLRTAGQELSSFKLPLALPEEDLDVHLRLLRQMKDEAQRSKSAWLAACWANYRSLYFVQQHGPDWTRKYLRAVTPTGFKFA